MALAQAPRIDSIDPSQGPIAGGAAVTIRGANFQGASVSVDKTAVLLPVILDTEIRFTTPRHDNGIASIKVANASGAAYAEFLYAPPKLKELPPGYITTVVGIGQFTGFFRPATQAEIQPQGNPAFDQKGNLYIPEPGAYRVSRVRPDGILEPFAGSGTPGGGSNGDGDGGPATEANISFPRGVTTDSSGNVYITDQFPPRIRRVDGRTGIITTIAGDGGKGFSGDGGPAVRARLNNPSHITGDGKGTLFFTDFDDFSRGARIRKITPDGIISTVAGAATPGFFGDGGPATQAQFNLIYNDFGSLALDRQGNLYIADTGNYRIRRIDGATGIITTVFGPLDPQKTPPQVVVVDTDGNLYFESGARIFKISPSGQTVATYGNRKPPGFSEDGTPVDDVSLEWIPGLAIEPTGSILYASHSGRIRRLNLTTGLIETVAGIGPGLIGENGPAIATTLVNVDGDLGILPKGELVLGDSGHRLLRKVDGNGNISTLAAGGLRAVLAGNRDVFIDPIAVKPDRAGNIYLADAWNIYRIDTQGAPHLVAGRPRVCGYSGDGGPAVDALVCQPWDVVQDSGGNLFIADTNNNRIRRVDAKTGIITTVAGSGPVNGLERYGQGRYCGDGGPATEACLNTPYGLVLDSAGNLFIADSGRIRKVDGSGIITTFVVTPAVKLVFDSVGYLYTRTGVGGVVRFDPAGNATRLAGQSSTGFSGDGGPVLQARLGVAYQSPGIAIDAEGNIFFTDGNNLRIRAVRFGAVLAPPNAQVQETRGTPQLTPPESEFLTPLEVLVLDSSSRPAPGVRVEFSAPPSGPSCSFSNGTNFLGVITDRSGRAQANCTANSQQGSYTVTVTPIASTATARFTLTNTPPRSRRRP